MQIGREETLLDEHPVARALVSSEGGRVAEPPRCALASAHRAAANDPGRLVRP